MEADPIGLEGGLNPYAYVGSNPVNAVDPSGLSTIVDNNYFVTNAYLDSDRNIYQSFDTGSMCNSRVVGQTLFSDSFISPDTGKAVGRVMLDQSIDRYISQMYIKALNDSQITLAIKSRPKGEYDIKATLGSYKGYLFKNNYVTGREAGNILAGMNAASHKVNFADFQKAAGALQGQNAVTGLARSASTVLLGKSYGTAPTYGENNYQYLRSQYGYNLVAPARKK